MMSKKGARIIAPLRHTMTTASIKIAQRASTDVSALAPFEESLLPAAMATLDGVFITAGLAEITSTAEGWTARLTKLDHPGGVASMFFTRGIREVLLRLEDGREARTRISATAFTAGNERECRLTGLTPLADHV
jgi:hypothetical protein